MWTKVMCCHVAADLWCSKALCHWFAIAQLCLVTLDFLGGHLSEYKPGLIQLSFWNLRRLGCPGQGDVVIRKYQTKAGETRIQIPTQSWIWIYSLLPTPNKLLVQSKQAISYLLRGSRGIIVDQLGLWKLLDKIWMFSLLRYILPLKMEVPHS